MLKKLFILLIVIIPVSIFFTTITVNAANTGSTKLDLSVSGAELKVTDILGIPQVWYLNDAIDGDLNTWCHIKIIRKVYVSIDLKKNMQINDINLDLRKNGLWGLIPTSSIELASDNAKNDFIKFNKDTQMMGRYIRIVLNNNSWCKLDAQIKEINVLVPNNGNYVELYQHINYDGRRIMISENNSNSKDFTKIAFNDTLSSFKIPEGTRVKFYRDINYQTLVTTLEGPQNIQSLLKKPKSGVQSNVIYNDDISSVWIEPISTPN